MSWPRPLQAKAIAVMADTIEPRRQHDWATLVAVHLHHIDENRNRHWPWWPCTLLINTMHVSCSIVRSACIAFQPLKINKWTPYCLHPMSFIEIESSACGWNHHSIWRTPSHGPVYHSQYHGWWCPGDASSQRINSHSIELFLWQYSDPSTKKIKSMASTL